MARLRPGRTCRYMHSQAWARYSQKKPRKNYIRALPHTSIQVFDMGKENPSYDMKVLMAPEYDVQLRSNALEAARQVANKHLEAAMPAGYYLKLMVYPHNVIREHKMSNAAGADRTSRGMSLAFGRPISVAARVRAHQPIFMVKTLLQNRRVVLGALKKASAKLSGTYKFTVS